MASASLTHRHRPDDWSNRHPPDNNRPASFTYLRSSLTRRPQLPRRPQTRPSKPRGLPCLGERVDLVTRSTEGAGEQVAAVSTPYRLPRLASNGQPSDSEDMHKVWSRHGYDVYAFKPVELHVLASALSTSPRVLTQELRRSHLSAAYPEFAAAVISPVRPQPPRHPHIDSSDHHDPFFHRGVEVKPPVINPDALEPEGTEYPELAGLETGPTSSPLPPFSRSPSPAKSGKSIHWALTQYRNIHLDKKGRSKVQGPYSREFTVTCSAPNNWLRMKFTRAKTVL